MNRKHGLSKTPIYGIWQGMIARCYNPNCEAYSNYGGRGIKVCNRWKLFENFYADMGDRPSWSTLDRINNNASYSPKNCQWRSRVEQGRNKRNNVRITIEGETMPLSAWCERTGVSYATAHQRIRIGWPPEIAVTAPLVRERSGVKRGERIAKELR